MTTFEWISMLLAPVTGVASWLAATRLRQNRTIREMQQTMSGCPLRSHNSPLKTLS